MKNYTNIVLISISSFLLIFPLLFFHCVENTEKVNSDIFSQKPTIVIDAGHGGEDGGAVSLTGSLEKDINLSISKKLQAFLVASGFSTKMTREDDNLVTTSDNNRKHSDLKNRADIFNFSNNNIAVSIHQNKFTQEQYYGTQVFYSANNSNSEVLAENIKHSVVSLIQNDNKRDCKKSGSEILILHNSNVPAVLVECGFLSNNSEAKLLDTDIYQSKMAYSIFLGILEFENIKIRNDNNGKS